MHYRMKVDEAAVQSVVDTVKTFINSQMYDGEEVVSLVSGVIAPDKTKQGLLSVTSRGEKAADEFIANRVQTSEIDFFSPIKAMKVSTFHNTQKKKNSQQAKSKIQIEDRSLYARLLVISRSRDIELEAILQYPLSTVSLPLANADGTLAKTVKSKLLHAIEADCKECEHVDTGTLEGPCALIVDAMALIQGMPSSAIPGTFGLFAEFILKQLSYVPKPPDAKPIEQILLQTTTMILAKRMRND